MVPFALSVVKQHLNLPHLAYKQIDPFPCPFPPDSVLTLVVGCANETRYCTRIGSGKGENRDRRGRGSGKPRAGFLLDLESLRAINSADE